MSDNRTTELRAKLTERGIEWTANDHMGACETSWNGFTAMQLTPGAKLTMVLTPDQAIAATLGRPKAKSHPYGYERDTGAYNCTRCECGCINDISATYCSDCGGEIEIDESAGKEFYEYNRNSVFVIKHDDGTLEFGGKRYVAATLGSDRVTENNIDKWLREFQIAHGELAHIGTDELKDLAFTLHNDIPLGYEASMRLGQWLLHAPLGEQIVRCRDCKHATISTMGVCKYCEMFVLPDTDGYGADPQVNLPLDFFCGFAERKEVD